MKRGAEVGSILGVIVFCLLGFMPGVYFGGYGAVSLLAKLSGGVLEPTLFSRIAVVAGMAVGVICMATVSVVLGALLGTVLGFVIYPKQAYATSK